MSLARAKNELRRPGQTLLARGRVCVRALISPRRGGPEPFLSLLTARVGLALRRRTGRSPPQTRNEYPTSTRQHRLASDPHPDPASSSAVPDHRRLIGCAGSSAPRPPRGMPRNPCHTVSSAERKLALACSVRSFGSALQAAGESRGVDVRGESVGVAQLPSCSRFFSMNFSISAAKKSP